MVNVTLHPTVIARSLYQRLINDMFVLKVAAGFFYSDSKALPDEIRQNVKGCAAEKGIGFGLKRKPVGATAGLEGVALWFWLICRVRPVRQGKHFAVLNFGSFFQEKERHGNSQLKEPRYLHLQRSPDFKTHNDVRFALLRLNYQNA